MPCSYIKPNFIINDKFKCYHDNIFTSFLLYFPLKPPLGLSYMNDYYSVQKFTKYLLTKLYKLLHRNPWQGYQLVFLEKT